MSQLTQRTVAAFEVGGTDVVEHQGAFCKMLRSQALLEAWLTLQQPVHKIFERSCEMGLFRLAADKVAHIFGVRVTKRLRGKLHSVLEKLDRGHHVMRIYCKNLVGRMYEKVSTCLRVEVCVNRMKDLGLNKGLENLGACATSSPENATVVGELLGELVDRGLDFTRPRLYVLDGGKALHRAVKNHAGDSALIQRCQVHKRRNILDHLTEEQKPLVATKLNAAYASEDYDAAKLALKKLHRELMDVNPSAARSLEEAWTKP